MRGLRSTVLILFSVATAPATAGGPSGQKPVPGGDFDSRASVRAVLQPTRSQLDALHARPGVSVRWDRRYGVPAVLIHRGGYLSGPHTDVGSFLQSQAALLGLTARDLDRFVVVQDYVTEHNGAHHVLLQQVDGARVVHGSLIKLTFDRDGRVVIMSGAYFPGASAGDSPALDAEQAVLAAGESIGAPPADSLTSLGTDPAASERLAFVNTVAKQVRNPDPITAELVTFPMPGGEAARLGWRVMMRTDAGWHEMVVDARSGSLLYRGHHTAHAGPEGQVFTVQHPDLGSRQIVSFAGAPFDNAGWVSDRATAGNNANAYEDLDNDDVADYQPQTPPSGDPAYQHFDFPFTDAFRTSGGTDVATDRDAAVTQAFYRINFLHDYFYALGFDEPAGNFQDDNFGRGGIGGDGMLVEVHNGFTGGPSENSNTQTPPGQRPRMELNVVPGNGADGAFDADLVTHEYTHGVSNRLVMSEAVGGGLPQGIQTWALGEGWSDFFGTSVYDDPVAGEYVCGNPTTGCPLYAYDNSPLVYSDLCTLNGNPPCEPHRDGEIWTAVLWDLREALGKAQTEQLVIDGMKNTTPALATYLDARDGILAADVTNNNGANQCLIWRVFAGREMGLSASTSADQSTVTAGTDVPGACVPTANAGGPYTTPEGTDVMLNGAGSTSGSDPSAGSIGLYEWDLDNDGQFDDATGAMPTFSAVGQDGTFTVRLRVTTSDAIAGTASTSVTVTNVVPAISLAQIAAIIEGGAITLSGMGSDSGWLDTPTATVDWDDGTGPHPLSGSVEHLRPDATLAFSQSHSYGDNGTFLVHVCVSDDDNTSCTIGAAVVANVNPTAVIGGSGQSTYDGTTAYIAHAGGTVAVEATSIDPGSDDLTLTWDWDSGPDAVEVSLVNPPASDPAKSPSNQPRNVTLSQSHVFDDACAYNLEFRAADDDGGAASDQALVIVVGNAARRRGSGWWMAQYRPHPPNAFSPQTLSCYLDIAVALSTVFNTPLSRQDAVDILFVKKNHGTAEELFDEQLLAAWLNLANGAIGLDDPVDTDGDGVNDSTFGAAVLTAEGIRTNPLATRQELLVQKDILERIVLRDD